MPLATVLPTTTRESAGTERRLQPRHPVTWNALCGRIADGMEPQLPAKVDNISASGIGLLTRRHLHPGTVLILTTHHVSAEVPSHLYARVVYAKLLPQGEWLIGCTFASQLDDDELRALCT